MKKAVVFTLAALTVSIGAVLAGAGSERPSMAPADGYTVDTVHSAVIFKIEHDGVGTFFGRFNDIEGSFNLDAANPESSTMNFTIKTDKVDTANADRDKHLRSPDFFNTKQFPEATFTAKSVKKKSDGAFDVTGDLTLMGLTKPVMVKVTNVKSGESPRTKKPIAGFEGVFTIKRSEFGITKYPGGLGEDVTIMVGIEGAK